MNTPTREVTALNKAVAAQIRSVLAWRNSNQATLARQMGVTEVWLSRRLREVMPLSLDDVERIAHALKLEPAELIAAAVKGSWQTTPEYFAPADRPKDTRPKGRPGSSAGNAPPNGAQRVRRSRVTGTPLAVASIPQVA
jgi:transcriptional regulator with XRE-family HTH domain